MDLLQISYHTTWESGNRKRWIFQKKDVHLLCDILDKFPIFFVPKGQEGWYPKKIYGII